MYLYSYSLLSCYLLTSSSSLCFFNIQKVVPLNTWVLISNFKLAYNLLRRPDGSFDRHLAEFLDRKVPANDTPVDGVNSFDILIHRPTNLLCRVYRPCTIIPAAATVIMDPEKDATSSSVDPFPVIIFFHGGSFAHSSSNSAIYDSLCRRFTSICNAVVISVNYRRSPEHRYPCAYEDGWEAVKWAASRSWLRSGKEEDSTVRIFLAGDSSGGNIAHHVAVRSIGSGIKILGNILLNSMFGGEDRKESELKFDGKYFVTLQDRDWYWKAFLPEGSDRNHPACSPFGPNGIILTGLPFPKSLITVAGLDLTRDWQLEYALGLKKAHQDIKLLYLEQATIGFYLLPNNEHFFVLMDEINKFVNSDYY